MSSAAPGPKSGGLFHALLTLTKPARFTAAEPTHASVPYVHEPRRGVPPLCDVYLPKTNPPHPSVLVVHGGGFVVGHRRMKPVRLVATHLADAGFAVCAIDYRLLFRGGGLDTQIEDVGAAAAYWRKECHRYGCDPSRISMLGFSAGATLMMLHAGTAEHSYHRLISIYGATDFERVSGRRAELLLRMVMGTRDRSEWRKRSPMTHAGIHSPLLLIHGTHDQLVPVEHATRLHELRRERGLPTELTLIDGMRHGWLNDSSLEETTQTLTRVLGFLSA